MYLRQIIFVLSLTPFYVNCVKFLECYECQSNIDPDCAIKPGKQLEVTDCPDNDKCVVMVASDGITHRGCYSSIITNGYCPSKTCKACETSLCNHEIYPPDRLKCYQCNGGTDCMNVTNSNLYKPLPCQYYIENDNARCFTDIIDKKKIVRGCVTKDKNKNCENICLKCNYDGCNNEPGTYNTTCQLCEYRHGPWTTPRNYGCKRNQTQYYSDNKEEEGKCIVTNLTATCSQVVLYGHKEKCFIHWDEKENSLKRGCSSNKNMFPTAKFWECYGDNCNSDCIDIKCNVCDSKTDLNCKMNTKVLNDIKCPDETVSCFSCENKDGDLRRGCGFQSTTNDEKCYHCFDENGCNRDTVRSCYKCTSTENINCKEWIDLTEIEHEKCSSPEELCVVTKSSKGYIVRGCETTTTECTAGDPDCKRCNGSLCNSGLHEHFLNIN
ncbi:uncharacterized protein LOC129618587 [Condylostylus longicornis]|uniref:uncharacterized protein LOC129618587 n=1 Tax=Condylostylus longicornis TaxID=2530218 RepID=UPI00244DFE65|nr:uncharacterized protein LOC129618587 [Condylostylus longicornis]